VADQYRAGKMKDPAVGRSRAERAFGSAKKTKKKKPARAKDVRNKNVGQFSGPRPSYVPYNVSEQAQDILNRSLNKKTR
jgi:hypothetical protein